MELNLHTLYPIRPAPCVGFLGDAIDTAAQNLLAKVTYNFIAGFTLLIIKFKLTNSVARCFTSGDKQINN